MIKLIFNYRAQRQGAQKISFHKFLSSIYNMKLAKLNPNFKVRINYIYIYKIYVNQQIIDHHLQKKIAFVS